jgi:hypothetical protein
LGDSSLEFLLYMLLVSRQPKLLGTNVVWLSASESAFERINVFQRRERSVLEQAR